MRVEMTKTTKSSRIRNFYPRVILIVGATCTGKTLVGGWLQQAGFHWIESSKYLTSRVPLNIPLYERLTRIDELFNKEGRNLIASKLVDEVLSTINQQAPIVITGLRQLAEREFLTRNLHVEATVISVISSDKLRYERACERGRLDIVNYEDFLRETFWEYSLGLGRLVFESKYIILNEGSLVYLHDQIGRIVGEIINNEIENRHFFCKWSSIPAI